MPDIKIVFRNGTERNFVEGQRSGGSYSQNVRYDNGVVIVKDVWGRETAFPLDTVAMVEKAEGRY